MPGRIERFERFERGNGVWMSSDADLLDRDMVLGFLAESYWAKGRARDEIWGGIAQSTPYGLYGSTGTQIGFVRVISDFTRLAWIGDLFVLEAYRGQGHADWMLDILLHHSQFRHVTNWQLSTRDAQALYAKHGFKVFEGQGEFMVLTRQP